MTPCLRSANVKDGAFDLIDVREMNFTPDEKSKYSLSHGDVLVTEGCGSISQIGASAAWRGGTTGTMCFDSALLRLRAIPGETTPGFVEVLARWAYKSGRWAKIASGTSIFHVGLERAKRMVVHVPPLEQQALISEISEVFNQLSEATSQTISSSRKLREGILTELLSGEHEIPDSYDDLLESV